MNVALGVFGRFHVFDLAKQLVKKRCLNQFFTSYPRFMVSRWKIDAKHVYCYPLIEILNRLHYKYLENYTSNVQLRIWFDYQITRLLSSDNDLYVCWGGAVESSLRARQIGIPIICEQGSTHILYAQKIRSEAAKNAGADYLKIPKKIIDREILTYELADYICVPSNFVKNSFIEYGIPESKIILNPYGVDLKSFIEVPKADDVFRIIFVGSICIRKGCHFLMKAFNDLNLDNSELIFIGPKHSDIEKYITAYRSPKIKFLGPKKQNELYKYYSQASVFVLMSVEEGLAMVQIQAMSCGLPLICSKNTGGEDLIENEKHGFVIDNGDIAALKDKIFYLYKNQDKCKAMGKDAKSRVYKGYSWDDYGDRMVDIYKKVLKY